MSVTGKEFTYVNQMASSDSDLSKRASWFTCACCPPNVTRLLGSIGGYLWSFQADELKGAINVNVHLYSSAILSIPIKDKVVEVEQKSSWPWDGTAEFEVRNVADIEVTICIRIPAWAESWQLTPCQKDIKTEKGYLRLNAGWIKENPKFTLSVPFTPRFVAPHPYTNQDIVALARGPLVYCLEDFDNPWVDDHFKSLVIDPACLVTEKLVTDSLGGEDYVSLEAHGGATIIDPSSVSGAMVKPGESTRSAKKLEEDLNFIPYCLRDNRGGKGHMRVGIRRLAT
jgi:DUF1680 family protein